MGHKMVDGKTLWEDEKGNWMPIANFEARIVEELRFVDGETVKRTYLITGIVKGEKTGPVQVPAENFPSMSWAANAWGSQAIVYPRAGAKDQVRTAIQLESEPIVTTIYTHTGWVMIDDVPHYLSNDSAITPAGQRSDLRVQLPPDLRRYSFPVLTQDACVPAVRASLALANLGPPDVGWAILGALYRVVISPVDFAVHISGRTGTFKSEYAALFQSHWGACTARELPASWSSTANALESLAYHAKDAIMVCDDFIPCGTSWQVKTYQKTADQLIRAQGNQAGRARLTDKSNLQRTMYPRGLILSTGEDTPEGHSVRARMFIAELAPGDIKPANLTKAQRDREMYPTALGCFIQWIAQDRKGRREQVERVAKEIRDANLRIGHARTPPTLGQILAGISLLLEFAVDVKAIQTKTANKLYTAATDAVTRLATQQAEYLTAADPADQFLNILRGILAANAGHLKAKNGGIPPNALLLGWTSIGDPSDLEFKPHGPRMGWVDSQRKIAYLDAAVAYDTIRRHSRGAITITRQTLYKRLREAGHLARTDDTRNRNTVRVALEHASRQVLALHLASLLEGEQR